MDTGARVNKAYSRMFKYGGGVGGRKDKLAGLQSRLDSLGLNTYYSYIVID